MTRHLELRDVERIAKDVLEELAVPLTVVAVVPAGTGWMITLQHATTARQLVTTVPDGAPAALRRRLVQWMEAED